MYQGVYDQARYMYEVLWYIEVLMPRDSVSLGASLLQVRDGMNCGKDEIPENTALCPIAFASKKLTQYRMAV